MKDNYRRQVANHNTSKLKNQLLHYHTQLKYYVKQAVLLFRKKCFIMITQPTHLQGAAYLQIIQIVFINGRLLKRFYFAGKIKPAIIENIIEWFYTKSIARNKNRFIQLIINHKCPHAHKFIDTGTAPLLVCGKNNFGITFRCKPITFIS